MTHIQAKCQGQKPVNSKQKNEMDRQTDGVDGWTEATALPPSLMWPVMGNDKA